MDRDGGVAVITATPTADLWLRGPGGKSLDPYRTPATEWVSTNFRWEGQVRQRQRLVRYTRDVRVTRRHRMWDGSSPIGRLNDQDRVIWSGTREGVVVKIVRTVDGRAYVSSD